MITLMQLAEAARNADSAVEISSLQEWAETVDVNLTDLHYIAQQRALRAAALLIDKLPRSLFRSAVFQIIDLSPTALDLMPVLMACVIDGFAIGRTVKDSPDGT